MIQIIYLPSGTIVSEHATIQDAETALANFETSPPSHSILEIEEATIETE